jgi:hypothetical protein
MLGLFSSKPILDENSAGWLIEAFAWALRNLDRRIFFEHTRLVTPSNEYFPDRVEDLQTLPATLFARVRNLAGMAAWDCELVMQDPDPELQVARTLFIRNAEQPPAGTFSFGRDEGKARITYNPNLLRDPERFIATMAHELAHYLSMAIAEPPPGGEEYHEHATDVLAVYMGFGLFQLNSTFSFRQFTDLATGTQGWATQGLGYLTRAESAFALAIFCNLKSIPVEQASRYLRQPQLGLFRKAMKDLKKFQAPLAGLLDSVGQPA